MLTASGVTTMECATLIFGLPITVVAYLVMAAFSKALRMERTTCWRLEVSTQTGSEVDDITGLTRRQMIDAC